MNEHLTAEQISEYVAGASAAAMEEHVHSCSACRTEVDRLSEMLLLFRESARGWSLEQESERPLIPLNLNAPEHRRGTLWHLGWTAAIAACLIAGLTLPRERETKQNAAHQAISAITDAELLGQVDHELSETVAPSMEPIALTEVKR